MDQEVMALLTKLVEDVSEIKQVQQDLQASHQDLKGVVDKLAINQENVIMPRLDLLYEGQATIINQLKDRATTDRVEELESTVHILVDATKIQNQEIKAIKSDIAELKQA